MAFIFLLFLLLSALFSIPFIYVFGHLCWHFLHSLANIQWRIFWGLLGAYLLSLLYLFSSLSDRAITMFLYTPHLLVFCLPVVLWGIYWIYIRRHTLPFVVLVSSLMIGLFVVQYQVRHRLIWNIFLSYHLRVSETPTEYATPHVGFLGMKHWISLSRHNSQVFKPQLAYSYEELLSNHQSQIIAYLIEDMLAKASFFAEDYQKYMGVKTRDEESINLEQYFIEQTFVLWAAHYKKSGELLISTPFYDYFPARRAALLNFWYGIALEDATQLPLMRAFIEQAKAYEKHKSYLYTNAEWKEIAEDLRYFRKRVQANKNVNSAWLKSLDAYILQIEKVEEERNQKGSDD